MTQNRPWSIWWDFRWEDDNLRWVVIQTDHPQYKHVDYMMKFVAEDCYCTEGYIDNWVKTWYNQFEDDIYTGRKSLHEIMKQNGYEKK